MLTRGSVPLGDLLNCQSASPFVLHDKRGLKCLISSIQLVLAKYLRRLQPPEPPNPSLRGTSHIAICDVPRDGEDKNCFWDYSKKLRRLRITEFVEPCHFQKTSSLTGCTVSFASNLQSRHPSSYPLLWPSSSPATNAARATTAKAQNQINKRLISPPLSTSEVARAKKDQTCFRRRASRVLPGGC